VSFYVSIMSNGTMDNSKDRGPSLKRAKRRTWAIEEEQQAMNRLHWVTDVSSQQSNFV